MSFADQNLSVVSRCCCRCHRKFLRFYISLKKALVDCNQTWHKASQDEGDSSFLKWRYTPSLIIEIFLVFIKNRLLKNNIAQKTGTCEEASSGIVDSIFFESWSVGWSNNAGSSFT